MAKITVICFLASYLLAFGFECIGLLRRGPIVRALALVSASAGLVAHTIYLLNQSHRAALPPLLSSPHDWFLVLAWLAIVVYLFLSLVDRELTLGLFLLPLVLVLIASSYFVSQSSSPLVNALPDEIHKTAIRHWAMLHATLLVFGIGCVLVGFVLSLMYLVQHRRLKHKYAMQTGMSLPSLERLARMTWWAIGTSVPLLLFGMITGIGLWYAKLRDAEASSLLDPVIIGNGVVWFTMMLFFGWLKLTQRPAARQVAWLTIWAFGLLLATLVGLEVLSPGHFSSSKHAGMGGRGWRLCEAPVIGSAKHPGAPGTNEARSTKSETKYAACSSGWRGQRLCVAPVERDGFSHRFSVASLDFHEESVTA